MDQAIKRHAATVRREGPGAISLLYYSGHGAADADTKTNYLIPVDVADADDADLWNCSLNLNSIVEGLRAYAPTAKRRFRCGAERCPPCAITGLMHRSKTHLYSIRCELRVRGTRWD